MGYKKRGLIYILISLITGSLFAIVVSGRLTKNLQKLITAAKKIKAGERDLRVGASNSREISELGNAFNQMLDDISANEKLLSLVLENMPVGVFILDENGKVVSLNPEGKKIWQGVKHVGPDEYKVYKGWFPDTGKEIESHEWGAYIALKEGRPVINQEAEIECFDKTRKYILNSCIPLRDANEKIIGVISMNVDITERKKAEAELLEHKEQLTLFIEHSPASLAMFDNEMKYIATSRRWMNDYNLGDQNIIGKSHYEVFPEIEEEWKSIHQRCLNGAIERKEEDFFIRTDGSKEWLKWEIRPWHKSNGKIGGVIMFTEVITERKHVEIRLEQSEERHRTLVENISDVIVLVDENMKAIYRSPSVKKVLGYSPEEIQDKTFFDLVHTSDIEKCRAVFREVFVTSGIPIELQCRMMHKSGEYVWLEGTVMNMLHNKSINAVIVNYRDITERKKATEMFKYQFENSPDIILIVNKDLNIESINKGQPGGLTSEQLIGKNCIEVLPEKDRHASEEAVLECFKTGISLEIENTISGNRWVRSRFVPIAIDGAITHVMIIATDITDVISSQLQVKQSEEKHRALTENISDAIMLLDENFENIYQSPSVERIIGYTMNDGSSKRALDFIHPDDIQIGFEFFQNSFKSPGVSLQSEFRVLHKSAHYIWIEGTVINLLHNESVKAFIVNYRDITERKNSEIKLAQSEEKHRALVENISDAIILVNDKLQATYRSPSVKRILGYLPEEIQDKTVFERMHPDDLEKSHAFFRNAYNNPGIPVHGQFRSQHKNGNYIWVEGTAINMLHNESINAIIVNYRDITERKNLEEQQLLITSIVNSSDDAIISKNLDGIITSWNKGAEKLLGYSFEEMIGRHISKLVPDFIKGEEKIILNSISEGKSVDHYETQRVTKDGKLIDVSLTVSPIRDSTGNITGASKVLRDITETKQYEQTLAKAAIKAQEEERYEIGAELHDNVGQLLATSQIFLGIMKKSLPEKSMGTYDNTQKSLTMAVAEIRNVSHRLAPVFFDEESFEQALKRLLKISNAENKYDISLKIDRTIKKYPFSRELQLNLYRILQEQLRNIIKHAKATSITVEITMKQQQMQLKIADNGIGFDIKTTKGGIGLANMNRRARLFSGTFIIDSTIGKGSRVVVQIPLVDTAKTL